MTSNDVTFSIKKCIDGTTQIVGKSSVDGSFAKYGVYSDKACKKKVGEIKIGENGTGSIKLSGGTYYVKELIVPTGYALSDDVYVLKSNQTVTVYEDFETGKIIINKTSEDKVVRNVEFKVTGSNGRSYTKKTNAVGIAILTDIPVYDINNKKIVYTISERDVPLKYVVPANQTVTLIADETVNVTFENKLKKFTAEVTKKDFETGVPQGEATLSGAVYGLYLDGELVDKYTTDENGCVTAQDKSHI